jgi:hypothetical protein
MVSRIRNPMNDKKIDQMLELLEKHATNTCGEMFATNYMRGYLHSFIKSLKLDSYQQMELDKNITFLKTLIEEKNNALSAPTADLI